MNFIKYIIDKFHKEDQSKRSIDQFANWLTDAEYQKEKDDALRSIWDLDADKASIENAQKAYSIFENQLVHNNLNNNSKRVKLSSLRLWQSIAASIFVIAGVSVYFIHTLSPKAKDLVEQYTPNSAIETIILPDGTTVLLNSETVLLYPSEFDGNTRSVYLLGEANFKVKKDPKKPFIVKTAHFQVTALGTEFNVASYAADNNTSVTLLSGSVLVQDSENLEKNKFILKPGEQFVHDKLNDQFSLSNEIDVEDVTSWQRGEIVIRDLTMPQILTLLERKYPIDFQYDESMLSGRKDKYNFSFRKEASINEVMDVIQKVSGNIHYSIQDNNCYIR